MDSSEVKLLGRVEGTAKSAETPSAGKKKRPGESLNAHKKKYSSKPHVWRLEEPRWQVVPELC